MKDQLEDPAWKAARAWATPVDLDQLVQFMNELDEAGLDLVIDLLTGAVAVEAEPEHDHPEAQR